MKSGRAVPRSLAHGAIIVLIILATYSGSFGGAFIYDDTQEILANQMIRSLDWPHLQAIFRALPLPNYQPITELSFAVDNRLWGLTPAGFHLTNLLIHLLSALLVYLLLVRLEMRPKMALVAALIWAVHPLQVESVAWISERKNVLSGLFFFAAFHAYLSFSERPRTRTYLGVLVLFTLAVLSKMNTMVLPAICLAYEAAFRFRPCRFRVRRRDLLASLPLFGIAAAEGWYTLSANPIHGGDFHGGSAPVSWLSTSVVVFRYLRNLTLPTDLCIYYDVRLRDSLLDPPVLLSVLGLAAILGVTVYLIAGKRRAGFWMLWFGIALAPMLNIIVPFRSMMNDRFMYLPMLGPIALLIGFLGESALLRGMRVTAAAAAAAGIVACAALSYERVGIWANVVSLWKDHALRFPYAAAEPVFRQQQLDAKLAYLQDVIRLDPSLAVARNNLGALYFESGSLAEAVPQLEAAAQLAPEQATILYNLARAYAYGRRLPEAKAVLKRAASFDPYDFQVQLTLGRVCRALGDVEGARRAYAACARIRPRDFNSRPLFEPEREFLRVLSRQAQPAGS